jgi:hypothetical protein
MDWQEADALRMATLVDFRRDRGRKDPARYLPEMDPETWRMTEESGEEILPGAACVLDLSQTAPDGEPLPSPGPGWFVYRVTLVPANELWIVATHEAHPYRVLGGPWPVA